MAVDEHPDTEAFVAAQVWLAKEHGMVLAPRRSRQNQIAAMVTSVSALEALRPPGTGHVALTAGVLAAARAAAKEYRTALRGHGG
jgi:hypothetical protein